jgi:hypothetical protein
MRAVWEGGMANHFGKIEHIVHLMLENRQPRHAAG